VEVDCKYAYAGLLKNEVGGFNIKIQHKFSEEALAVLKQQAGREQSEWEEGEQHGEERGERSEKEQERKGRERVLEMEEE
jgi:hypothetical protein